jgi:Ca2+-binding RTX toxin-like protein
MARRVGNDKDNTLSGTGDADEILGRGGDDTLKGKGGNDLIEGGSGNDKAWGGNGADEILGGGGNDRLWGDAGNDELYGGGGNDKLWGGTGNDVMAGGKGNDRFYFLNPNSARDEILDFKIGEDKLFIDLSAYGFGSVQELIDNSKSSGGDSNVMLDVNDPGNDQLQIILYGVSNHFQLKNSIVDIDA